MAKRKKYNVKIRGIVTHLLRVDNVCKLCLKPILKRKEATADHIVPISKGGPDTLTNLQLAHERCNSLKGNNCVEI